MSNVTPIKPPEGPEDSITIRITPKMRMYLCAAVEGYAEHRAKHEAWLKEAKKQGQQGQFVHMGPEPTSLPALDDRAIAQKALDMGLTLFLQELMQQGVPRHHLVGAGVPGVPMPPFG